MTTALHSSLSR